MSNSNSTERSGILITLYDKDIFPDTLNADGVIWKDRPTGKVVLFNEKGEIALIGNKINDFFLLPGGGIEDNEPIIEGVKRECQEETGCQIEIIKKLGTTEDFRLRDGKHCISHGYSANVISYGSPTFTANELDIGAYVRWIPLAEARSLFIDQENAVKKGEVKFYNTCFNILRDSLFIQIAEDSLDDITG